MLLHYRVTSNGIEAKDITAKDEEHAKGLYLSESHLLPTQVNLGSLNVIEHAKDKSWCYACNKCFCEYSW